MYRCSGLDLVLLGHHRHGLSSFQCVFATVSAKRGEEPRANAYKRRVPELCYHLNHRRSWFHHWSLHRGYQIHRSEVHHRGLNIIDSHLPVRLHRQLRFKLSARDDLLGSLFPEHHVWCSIRIVGVLVYNNMECGILTQLQHTRGIPCSQQRYRYRHSFMLQSHYCKYIFEHL